MPLHSQAQTIFMPRSAACLRYFPCMAMRLARTSQQFSKNTMGYTKKVNAMTNVPKPFEWCDMDYFKTPEWAALEKELPSTPISPSWDRALRMFDETPYADVRVLIIAQEPYLNPKYASGLAFSVPEGIRPLPPVLRNIYKELHDDIGCPIPSHGNLTRWARQGVLLLNTTPTCEPWKPASHCSRWSGFAGEVFDHLAKKKDLVVVAWGREAKDWYYYARGCYLNNRYLVSSAHPSPFSAHTGFFGSRPFSAVNRHLKKFPAGRDVPIDWDLTAA